MILVNLLMVILKELKYTRKRFEYPFYNEIKYIVKHNGKYAIVDD